MARKAFFCAEQPQTHVIPVSSTPFSMTVMLHVISQMEMLGLFLMLPSDVQQLDYNMTYTWFWTAHGSAGKHKYQCFHYLFVYVETASLVLGKLPRVFSKRLLHIINKNVKVSFSCFSNCLHFSGRYITVLHSLINSCCFYSFQSNHYCHFHVCVRLKTLEGF